MKITMYELLGLVKDGKAPKKIKAYGKVYINNNCNCYLDEKDKSLCANIEIPMFLNDEVEILEEEKKIPEKITINDNGTLGFPNGEWTARNMDKAFAIKFNQLIDYLESKGDE